MGNEIEMQKLFRIWPVMTSLIQCRGDFNRFGRMNSPLQETFANREVKFGEILSNLGLDHYLGQTVAGIVMTESGLLVGAHLVGVGGLKTFLTSNGAQIPHDANNTAITHYISTFNGYNLAPITGTVTAGGSAGSISTVGNGNNGAQSPVTTVWQPLINPSAAFTNSAGGVSYQELKTAIQSIIAILLLLWIAFVSWSQFKKIWGENSISIMAMKSNIVRATALMMLLLFIFML